MKNALKIFGFTVLVSAFYSYVGQMVPQKVTYPPEDRQLSADLTTAELVEVGRELVEGKGTCLTCHTVGSTDGALRFPDLGGIGAVAATRRPGQSDVEYLAEALYDPGAYIVEGFQAGMPPIGRPPISLTDAEILAVIAYLQSLGGTPTVTMQTKVKYAGEAPASPPAPASAAAPGAASGGGAPLSGEAVFAQYLCGACHSLDAPTPMVGPSLQGVGSRMTKAQLYEAIMDPDATLAAGFPAGVMPATLQAGGFYDRISAAELRALIDYLSSKTGP